MRSVESITQSIQSSMPAHKKASLRCKLLTPKIIWRKISRFILQVFTFVFTSVPLDWNRHFDKTNYKKCGLLRPFCVWHPLTKKAPLRCPRYRKNSLLQFRRNRARGLHLSLPGRPWREIKVLWMLAWFHWSKYSELIRTSTDMR